MRIHYIEDAEIAKLFEEECSRGTRVMKKLRGHPYFSFLDEDTCASEEEESFCNSFYRSLEA